MTIAMSPVEQVLAQLGRQKWAVDTRDAAALKSLYTADSAQVIYQGGPDGAGRSPDRAGAMRSSPASSPAGSAPPPPGTRGR